jgi:hypothetical protein
MNFHDFKALLIRLFRNSLLRGVVYYTTLLIGSFFLFAGSSLIVRKDEDYRLIGWIYTVLGSITVLIIIKFQGWFFPKTENAELKQPTKILTRFAHTARSILLLIVFYFLYLISFIVFYITHFAFIHHVPWIRMEGDEALNEWCIFGDHTNNFGTETIDLVALYPLVMAIVSIIAFNHTNRIVRLILFLLPFAATIIFLFLHFSCMDAILLRIS